MILPQTRVRYVCAFVVVVLENVCVYSGCSAPASLHLVGCARRIGLGGTGGKRGAAQAAPWVWAQRHSSHHQQQRAGCSAAVCLSVAPKWLLACFFLVAGMKVFTPCVMGALGGGWRPTRQSRIDHVYGYRISLMTRHRLTLHNT